MKWLRNYLFPKFIKQFDHYLLTNEPLIWSSRIHKILFLGISILGINLLLISFLPLDFESPIVDNTSVLIWSVISGILLLLYWLYTQALFNFSLQFGVTKKFHELKVSILFFLVFFVTVFIMVLPELYYSSRVRNFFLHEQIDHYPWRYRGHVGKLAIANDLTHEDFVALVGLSELIHKDDSVLVERTEYGEHQALRVTVYPDREYMSYSRLGARSLESYLLMTNVQHKKELSSLIYTGTIEEIHTPILIIDEYDDSTRAEIRTYKFKQRYFDEVRMQTFLIADSISVATGLDHSYKNFGWPVDYEFYRDRISDIKLRLDTIYYDYYTDIGKDYDSLVNEIDSLQILALTQDQVDKSYSYHDEHDHAMQRIGSAIRGGNDFMPKLLAIFILVSIISYLVIFATYIIKYFNVKIYVLGIITPVFSTYFILMALAYFLNEYEGWNVQGIAIVQLSITVVVILVLWKLVSINKWRLRFLQWLIYALPTALFTGAYFPNFSYSEYSRVSNFDRIFGAHDALIDSYIFPLVVMCFLVYFLLVPLFATSLFKIYSSPS